jgi:hypothetical protein
MSVVLAYPNGRQREVLLAGVPRVGEHIRLADSKVDEPSLEVDFVLWSEGEGRNPDPTVVVSVHPRKNGPPG